MKTRLVFSVALANSRSGSLIHLRIRTLVFYNVHIYDRCTYHRDVIIIIIIYMIIYIRLFLVTCTDPRDWLVVCLPETVWEVIG